MLSIYCRVTDRGDRCRKLELLIISRDDKRQHNLAVESRVDARNWPYFHRRQLMDRDIAAGEEAAGRITIAKMDGKEIVGAGLPVVGHVTSETDLLFSNFSGAREMRLVTGKGQ